jgi:hypothetical protein
MDIDENRETFEWLQSALAFEDWTHYPDDGGRLAIPLDRRVLVPSPGDSFASSEAHEDRSAAEKLAKRVLTLAAADAEVEIPIKSSASAAEAWSKRLAVILALVEAAGHHVTFREALALSADVAESLVNRDQPAEIRRADALARLFQFRNDLDPLADAADLLRRLDPARSASPRHDVSKTKTVPRRVRDRRLRQEGVERLVELFQAPSDIQADTTLPYRYGTTFLKKCSDLGDVARDLVGLRRQVRTLAPTRKDGGFETVADTLQSFGNTLGTRPARADVPEHFFRGLATFAWGSETDSKDDEIIPLTSPLQPGSLEGKNGWRVMRGAIGNNRAYLQVNTADYGPYIERGLARPKFVLEGPGSLEPSPPLPLDLDLYERLARMSETGVGTRALGQRESQVRTWLDSVVSHWEKALTDEVDGLVVFETLLGDNDEAPVALRPSESRTDDVDYAFEKTSLQEVDVLDILTDDDIWPEKASDGTTIAVTPAACASALLQWAGFEPERHDLDVDDPDMALREAAGAGGVERLRTRTNFTSPAFPWSDWMLGVGINDTDPVSFEQGEALGRACAAALDLGVKDDHGSEWAEALRSAWAEDEEVFDVHPSARFCHQWLGMSIDGLQLESHQKTGTAPTTTDSPVAHRVLGALLEPHEDLPFSPVERWWLIGTWAAWHLMRRGLDNLHCHHGNPVEASPVLVPSASDSYKPLHDCWFRRNTNKRTLHARDAVAAVGQATGFLTPSSSITRFDLTLDGALKDIIRLVAWDRVRETEHDGERTVASLQQELRRAGLFVRSNGPSGDIPEHLPANAPVVSPGDDNLRDRFRQKLSSLGMLDLGSDGKDLFVSPWKKNYRS